jgi:Zinc carboxypeptidase/Secretion system C-terminal sorting domain
MERQRHTGFGKRWFLLVLSLPFMLPLGAQWTQSVQFNSSDMALDLAEARSFQKYPTYEHYLQLMRGFASDYPELCRLDTFGTTQEGRLLLALKISDQVDQDEPEADFLYTSSMHGNEIVGLVLLLRLADTLLSGYGTDSEITTLVDKLQIWINPLANPDGAYSADQNLSLQHAVRLTADGTDLNRNFPDPGVGEADDTTGRALENRFMMEFLRQHRFSLSANLHSGEEVVNYPWDYTLGLHADDNWYRFISGEYADEAMAVDPSYMFGWPDGGITNGAVWYVARGTRQDYVNYYLGGREVTLELSHEFLLSSDELEQHWKINQRSLINYMGQCLYGIRGTVKDLNTGDPLGAAIRIPGHDSAYSVVHSSAVHGDFYRLIKEGIYDLVISAPGYHSDTLESVTVSDYQSTLLEIRLKPYGLAVAPKKAPAFKIYPNPAIHSFMIEPVNLPDGELSLSILSVDGTLVYSRTFPLYGGGIEISTEEMQDGIYLLHCSFGSLSEVHRLIVINP